MANPSLLRYPGGKTKAVKHLLPYFPADLKELVSPFFGGGSLELTLAKRGVHVWGYDNFRLLVLFWKAVLNDRAMFEKVVRALHPISKEGFYALQKKILTEEDETLAAAYFYVLNRASFSGTILSGGLSPKHPRFNLSNIASIAKFSAFFTIEEAPFEKSLSLHNCLAYCDPPYIIPSNLYGVKGSHHKEFNHQLLADTLNSRGNFILSYNNCEEVKDLYYKHSFFYPSWAYGMGANKESKEILIVSKA